jgi:hypothetical protein
MDLYHDPRHPDEPGPTSFRADFSVTGTEPVPIKCIGVWDTVGALGIPLLPVSLTSKRYQFHDTSLSKIGLTRQGTVDASQSLHAALLERWDRDSTYRPQNLAAYFATSDDARKSAVQRRISGFFSRRKAA